MIKAKHSFDKEFYRSMLFIAAPIILQNFVNSFINMLDTIMVGRLGEVSIAAVGLGNNFFFFFNMILFGITSGCGIFVAQYWGKRDILHIRQATGISLLVSVLVSLLFFAVIQISPQLVLRFYSDDPEVIAAGEGYLRIVSWSYPLFALGMVFGLSLRSVENPRVPMIASVVSLLVNALFNWLLIFGVGPFPQMGIRGAALATLISHLGNCVILLAISYRKKLPPAGKLKELFGFSKDFAARFLRIGAPVIINETIWSFGITLQNAIMARAGTDAYAAFNITGTISNLTWIFLMGIGNAAAVLIGKKIGEGNRETAFAYANRCAKLVPVVGILVGAMLWPLSLTLKFFFNVSPHIITQAQYMLRFLTFMYPFNGFNMLMVTGVCRSGGDTVYSAVADVLFMYVLSLPLAAVATFMFHAPAIVIYICIMSDNFGKALMLFLRLKSRKWLHDVTK